MEHKLLTKHVGEVDLALIDNYIIYGGYQTFCEIREKDRLALIERVKEIKLYGRGGANFPTWMKMNDVFKQEGLKYLICNADEGEPGNFKDKFLLENNPHQLIEGMIIAAHIVGASVAYVYIREEYDLAKKKLLKAINEAKIRGFLDDLKLIVFSGAGSYLCGEESALISSLEGIRGKTRQKPPFPTTSGLFDKPTLLLNVETLSNMPHLFKADYPVYGTRLISLSGKTDHAGVYEVLNDIVVKDFLDQYCQDVYAVILGGPSGMLIPYHLSNININMDKLEDKRFSIGSGALIIADDNILELVKNNIGFFNHESCGKCTPCREGLTQILVLLDKFIMKKASMDDLIVLKELTNVISVSSFCGLGLYSVTTLLSALEFFEDKFLGGINESNN